MRTGLGAAAGGHLLRTRRRWLGRLLLAASLVVVALSIVGMHQLSLGHDLATRPTATSAHAEPGVHIRSGEMLPGSVMMAEHLGAHSSGGMPGGGEGDACPDCGDHLMTFGSCLLALTLLVLHWMLAPPRESHVLRFLLPRLTSAVAVSAVGRLVPPLSLAELSVLRT